MPDDYGLNQPGPEASPAAWTAFRQAYSERAMTAHRQHRQALHSELRAKVRNADCERALAVFTQVLDAAGIDPWTAARGQFKLECWRVWTGWTSTRPQSIWSPHGLLFREQLLAGTYRPSPVRRVLIPKPDGGERELGIPTVTDRLIQQALLQVLQPILDPTFSEHSYGFRPGRRAQDAVLAAQAFVQAGRRVVVDVDLEKFFDRVNHDILIDRLNKRLGQAGVIWLIRAYLDSGIMTGGVVQQRYQGTPQGGRSMSQVVHGLRPYLLGWKAYFGLAQTPSVWRELDEWLRHRLPAIQLKQCRRGTTLYRELRAVGAKPGVARTVAANSRRWWRNCGMLLNSVLTIAWFDRLGLPRLS